MKKNILLASAMALMAMPALAQNVKIYETGRKWAGEFDALVEGKSVRRIAARGTETVTPEMLVEGIVNVNDAEAVARFIQESGYEATVINEGSVVIEVPGTMIKTIAARKDVNYISASKQFRPLMANVRPETGVEKVTTGEGLETPFTGKGVVVGVIDQGFQYDHAAFNGRVVRYGQIASGGSLTTTRPAKDQYDDNGHATHVTGIAAGSKLTGCNNYGIATGADLVLISSNFSSSSVLKQAKAIKKYAEDNNQPWVVNMSFGAVIGPHDGSTQYDQDMSKLTTEGGLLVAAMGNEGGSKMHAERDFETNSQAHYLYIRPNNNEKIISSTIYSKANDGVEHLTIQPVLIAGGKAYEPTVAEMRSAGFAPSTGIDPLNNRQHYEIAGSLSNLAIVLGISTTNYDFFWKVTGKTGDGFHAWCDGSHYGNEFYAKSTTVSGETYRATSGDDNYLCGEGAASIPTAIAVASYNAASKYTNINGSTLSFYSSVGAQGAMSKFSSPGPQIVPGPKPAIAAPGGVVLSTFSANSTDFSATNAEVTNVVTVNGKKYYYGVMSGTSMASPVVTGIMALWLEANPKLTYDQVLQIFKETGRRSTQTGTADADGWNASAGYGKIDAYEGLKKALEMANTSGINETLNTTAPITLQKDADAWKILFNNDETFANVALYSLNGACVMQQQLSAPRRGEEVKIDLTTMQPGVYLFKVQTTASTMTRKVVVK